MVLESAWTLVNRGLLLRHWMLLTSLIVRAHLERNRGIADKPILLRLDLQLLVVINFLLTNSDHPSGGRLLQSFHFVGCKSSLLPWRRLLLLSWLRLDELLLAAEGLELSICQVSLLVLPSELKISPF